MERGFKYVGTTEGMAAALRAHEIGIRTAMGMAAVADAQTEQSAEVDKAPEEFNWPGPQIFVAGDGTYDAGMR